MYKTILHPGHIIENIPETGPQKCERRGILLNQNLLHNLCFGDDQIVMVVLQITRIYTKIVKRSGEKMKD